MRPTRARAWVLAFLVAVLAVVLGAFTAGPASAATTSGAQTRVGASAPAAGTVVGPSASITAGQRLGNSPVRPGIVVATGVAADTAPSLVYRGLAAGEDATAGLVARAPGATGVSPISHVAGKIQSPWISTTKSIDVATGPKYGGNGGVAIDLNKVTSEVVDVSGGFPNGGRFSSWAIADQEVLIRGSVPPEAIVGKW